MVVLNVALAAMIRPSLSVMTAETPARENHSPTSPEINARAVSRTADPIRSSSSQCQHSSLHSILLMESTRQPDPSDGAKTTIALPCCHDFCCDRATDRKSVV